MKNIWPGRIDAAIRFFICLLIFFLPYSPAVLEISVISGCLLWLAGRIIRFFTNEDCSRPAWYCLRLRPTPLNTVIGIFLGACLFSVAGSAFPAVALKGFITKTVEWFVVFFLVTETFTDKKHFRAVLAVFAVTSLAVCLDSLFQYYVSGKDIFRQVVSVGRASGPFRNANQLGSYLTVAAPIFAAIGINSAKSRKISFLFLTFLAGLALLLTFSRGAVLSIVFAIFIFGVVFYRRAALSGLLVVVLLVGLIFWVLPGSARKSFRVDRENVGGTISWREGLWEDSLAMIADRPFFGHGINTFMRVFQQYRRKFQGRFDFDPSYAHNCYLQLAAETGVFGFLAFLGILVKFFWALRNTLKRLDGEQFVFRKKMLLAASVAVTAFLFHSGFDVNFYSLQLSVLFWAVLGFAVAGMLLPPEQGGESCC